MGCPLPPQHHHSNNTQGTALRFPSRSWAVLNRSFCRTNTASPCCAPCWDFSTAASCSSQGLALLILISHLPLAVLCEEEWHIQPFSRGCKLISEPAARGRASCTNPAAPQEGVSQPLPSDELTCVPPGPRAAGGYLHRRPRGAVKPKKPSGQPPAWNLSHPSSKEDASTQHSAPALPSLNPGPVGVTPCIPLPPLLGSARAPERLPGHTQTHGL